VAGQCGDRHCRALWAVRLVCRALPPLSDPALELLHLVERLGADHGVAVRDRQHRLPLLSSALHLDGGDCVPLPRTTNLVRFPGLFRKLLCASLLTGDLSGHWDEAAVRIIYIFLAAALGVGISSEFYAQTAAKLQLQEKLNQEERARRQEAASGDIDSSRNQCPKSSGLPDRTVDWIT